MVKRMRKIGLRIWLVVWVITLPLLHIHPEVDHAQRMSGHVYGGTYHSILISTPVHAHQGYAQEEHHHDGFFSLVNGLESTQVPLHGSHSFEEATYGFSLIKSSIILESQKAKISYDVVVTDHVEPLRLASASMPTVSLKKTLVSLLPEILSPRAPPIFLI